MTSQPKQKLHPKDVQPQNAKPAQPKVIMKNQREMRHDLFKAELHKFKKNTEWRKGMVSLIELEHTHIYHTINSQCKTQKYTNAVGGHFHEITTAVDAEGNIVAKCGPPLRYGVRRLPNGGFKKKLERCTWFDGMNGPEGREIVDDHIHDMTYLSSEMINVDSAKKLRNMAATAAAQPSDGFKDMDQ